MIRDWAWNDDDFVLSASGDVAFAEEAQVVAQDILARLVSPKGSHWAFPEDGLDSQKFIQATADELTVLELRQDVELEVLNDARVRRSAATVTTPDLRTGNISVLAELRDQALRMGAPFPVGLIHPEREYGTFFVAGRKGAVVELAANRIGSFAETDEEVSFIDMNPAQFLGRKTITLTIQGVDYSVEVVEINV